jgi:hypothetical protein
VFLLSLLSDMRNGDDWRSRSSNDEFFLFVRLNGSVDRLDIRLNVYIICMCSAKKNYPSSSILFLTLRLYRYSVLSFHSKLFSHSPPPKSRFS